MESQEITVAEILKKIRPFVILIKKNFIYLFVFALVFAVIGVFLRPKTVYIAQSKLLPKSSSGGGYSGLLSIASAYGLGSDEGLSVEKFTGVAKSESILKNVLLKKATVDGTTGLIISHVIKEKGYDEIWKESRHAWLDLNFEKAGIIQDSVYKFLIPKLSGMVSIAETEQELISVSVSAKSEDLAIAINNSLVDEALKFFEKSSISDDKRTQEILENRLDSLKSELFTAEQKMADLKDQSFQTVKTKGLIDMLRVERNLRILNEMYVEATKQSELVNFKILSSSSSLNVIDRPFAPLEDFRKSFVTTGVIFGLIGGILGVFTLLLWNYWKDILSYFKEE